MTELSFEDIVAAYATGNPEYCAMVDGWADMGIEFALEVQAEVERDRIEAELDTGVDWANVDLGQAQALIALLGEGDPQAFAQLNTLSESDAPLASYIIQTAAGEGAEWAVEAVEYTHIFEEAAEAARHDGVPLDPAEFERAYQAAKEDGNPGAAYAFFRGELEPTPPEVQVRSARPHEVPGGEGKRHVVTAHSDGYDRAFAEFFAEDANRRNGHPAAIDPDPEIFGDPIVVAYLDSAAKDMQGDLDRAERVHRHAQEVQRRRGA
jgi:hypothetical protein